MSITASTPSTPVCCITWAARSPAEASITTSALSTERMKSSLAPPTSAANTRAPHSRTIWIMWMPTPPHCRLFHAAGRNRTQETKFSLVCTYRAEDNLPLVGTKSASVGDVSV
ncbi:MAG: hypothetical protein WCS09_21235 [Pseudomonadota bacterium]